MKKINIFIIISLLFTSCLSDTIQVKNNNNIKVVHLKNQNISKLLIKFNTNSDFKIKELLDKHNLKVSAKLKIGYYVIEDKDKNNIEKYIIEDLSNEDIIKTVKPKYKLKLKTY